MKLYYFTGAGNNFVVLDGRGADMTAFRETARIRALCREYCTDGLMILDTDPELDFSMEFYNPDGSGGMMCGNGGRCIAAFADYLGIPSQDDVYRFRAPDGPHVATILGRPSLTDGPGACPTGPDSNCWRVRLQMKDVQGVTPVLGGWFLDTGTRHFVRFVPEVGALDMEAEAKPLRWDAAFAPVGANVNLVEAAPDGLHVRTYEKGVEGETLACGTGLTASAIAARVAGIPGQAGNDGPAMAGNDGSVMAGKTGSVMAGLSPVMAGPDRPSLRYRLQCRRGDWLQVDFVPTGPDSFKEVFLTGPAELLQITDLAV